jgi:hypothetical protein
MPWIWRKIFRFGPFRSTLSNRGWGWSFGLSFIRYGVGPSGTPYVSIGIPGTGLYFTKFLKQGTIPKPLSTSTPQAPQPNVSSSPTQLTANQRIVQAYKSKGNP